MNENDNSTPDDAHKRPKAIAPESASGASLNRGHTLLPMLIGGLVLVILGMIAVVLIV
jgi:hypothetical protein